MSEYAYQDASRSVAERVDDLLGRLSLEEKAGQLTQYFYFPPMELPDGVDLESLPERARKHLGQPAMVEAELAAGRVGSLLFVCEPAEINRLQRLAMDGNRWGIPVIFGYDVIHGLRTMMPVPIALAASWCPATAEEGQAVAAREARAVGIHWTFAPMVDIARDPRWGRIIEGAGEDPVLGAAMAAAQVRGFQGGDRIGADGHVIAGPKHFAGYGAARGGRDYDDSDISDAELHNVYLPPFRAAVEAGAGNIMSAYMDLNGVPASANHWLLTEVLRDEWGFDGWVVSDANAVFSLTTQHFAKDLTDAGARALAAGEDMEMCQYESAFAHLPEAIAAGAVNEAKLDEAVRRVLTAKFEIGLFDQPFVAEDAADGVLSDPEHREVARRAAERTFVLLKNAGGLPLASEVGSIAVLGPLADSPRDVLGPWSFDFDLDEAVDILAGIKRRAGDGVRVEHAAGALPGERLVASMFDGNDRGLQTWPDFDEDAELARAVELAEASEVAVLVVGQSQNMIGESASASTLELPGGQQRLLEAVLDTGTPTLVVVMSGRPLDLRVADERAAAILQVWYPGTRGGDAVAAALFGDFSPAGRLPFTWPRHVGQVPLVYSHYRTFAPDAQGERYWDGPSTPLYPFGHGLSYASFDYANLRLDRDRITVGESATVSFDVTNTSDLDADEVVQLYIHQQHGTSSRPLRELKGFERVHIEAGATRTVEFDLGPDQLRYWSSVTRDWVQDATTIEVWVGGSSLAELGVELIIE